jgi:hypothetical protein
MSRTDVVSSASSAAPKPLGRWSLLAGKVSSSRISIEWALVTPAGIFFESNILRSPAGLTVLLGQAKGRDAPPTDQDGTTKAITPVGRLVKFLIAVVLHHPPRDEIDKNDGGTLPKELQHGFHPLGFQLRPRIHADYGHPKINDHIDVVQEFRPTVAGEMGSNGSFLMPKIL